MKSKLKFLVKVVFMLSITYGSLYTIAVFGQPKTYGSATLNEITSIYDGDTFRATINWWPDIIGDRISIRVKGIDTPELRGKCQKEKDLALKAKQFTVAKLRSASKVRIKNMERGKYFRIVADVMIHDTEGVSNLGHSLLSAGLAKIYDGTGTKYDWCL